MEKLRFEDLNLSEEIYKAVKDMGFEEATPIQSESIPEILKGIDVIGQAQTGTGKTAAFGIPALEMVVTEDRSLQTVILCPTRELAIQVAEEIRRFSKYKENIKILAVYGGQPIDRQIRALKGGVQIIIGTPGRVMDHMRRRTLKMETVKFVVLDEADEMLNMGFREDIETILKSMPEERQTVLFSATMPKPILDLTKLYQKNPKMIKVAHKELTVPQIEQFYFEVKPKDKPEILSRLLDMYNPKQSLVFCNTKRQVDELLGELQLRGYEVDALHGDMRQSQRDNVMGKFRRGDIEILVATDVAARGIDVNDVEVVFNYDVPQDEEYYVHRIGRTGRAGRAGKAFTFVVGKDIYKLKDIQRYTKTRIIPQQAPSAGDVEEVRMSAMLEKVKGIIDEEDLNYYKSLVERLLSDDYTSLDIASALFRIVIGKDVKETKAQQEYDFEDTGAESGMARLFINVGRKNKISPKDVLGSICNTAGIEGKLIGTIDIYDKYTFVEVPKQYARQVIEAMKDNKIKGNKVNIEPANKR